jgi:hypothetical protein
VLEFVSTTFTAAKMGKYFLTTSTERCKLLMFC